ncbi:hypothetical protein QWZ04_23030 [Vibrio tapetis subsp. quintayensis]|uniref:hypothetical protein n=1 Tax=Vibrio tapetis TaxID=52443 RepID=UPI0025B51383|nr:hypothetical protein [Vibrio tapetis]MDN3683185.1 hypothetical protein [Vibrio tapetis subsp. quintayensis]
MRNFIDTKLLSWPLTPELESKKVGKLVLYLSPDIPEQTFFLEAMLKDENLSIHKRKAWAGFLRGLAEELDPTPVSHEE